MYLDKMCSADRHVGGGPVQRAVLPFTVESSFSLQWCYLYAVTHPEPCFLERSSQGGEAMFLPTEQSGISRFQRLQQIVKV